MLSKVFRISEMAGQAWCGLMHDQVTWPVNGRYRCRTCGREYAVRWEAAPRENVGSITYPVTTNAVRSLSGSPAPANSGVGRNLSVRTQTTAAYPV